jgi:hypothetical protein
VCCATERVLVDKRVHDDFLAAVVKEAGTWTLGDPFDDSTLVGPMNNEPTAQKMDAHLEDAVSKGAEVVLGGERDGGRPTGLYYQPTVVDGVGVDTLINRDETFGPIVPLITVADDDEALAVANDSHLGLQAAVYTTSLKRAFRFLDNLQVGNVVVNDSTDYWEARKSSWTRLSTSTRSVAQHTWPAQKKPPKTAPFAAASRSASAQTTTGPLPLASISERFSPAARTIFSAVVCEPMKPMQSMFSSWISRSPTRPSP